MDIVVFDFNSIDVDFSLVLVEPLDELEESRFSWPRRPHKPDLLPPFYY